MSQDLLSVLKLVQEGKLSPEEADQLIEAINVQTPPPSDASTSSAPFTAPDSVIILGDTSGEPKDGARTETHEPHNESASGEQTGNTDNANSRFDGRRNNGSSRRFTGILNGIPAGSVLHQSIMGPILGDIAGALHGNITGPVSGDISGQVHGNIMGPVGGDITGMVDGNIMGPIGGDMTGHIGGNVTGPIKGDVSGSINGTITGSIRGDVSGRLLKSLIGSIDGDISGKISGNVVGMIKGDVTGYIGGDVGSRIQTTSSIKGDVTGTIEGSVYGTIHGDVAGNIGGNVYRIKGNIGKNAVIRGHVDILLGENYGQVLGGIG